jgi:hypothetical protein
MGSAQMNDRGLGGTKYVRVHSLETGQPITLRVAKEDGGGMTDLMLLAQEQNTVSWDIHLRCVGSRLYVQHPRGVLCYDLDRPDEFWHVAVDDDRGNAVATVRDMFLGKSHAVLFTQLDASPVPPAAPARRNWRYQLNAIARYPGHPGGTAESGKTDYIPVLSEAAAITQWQPVDGGFYYRTDDNKLHYLTPTR